MAWLHRRTLPQRLGRPASVATPVARAVGMRLGAGIASTPADRELARLRGRQLWDPVHRPGKDLVEVSQQSELTPVDGG
jgi:hypothetical protein